MAVEISPAVSTLAKNQPFWQRTIHSSHHLRDNSEERILALMSQARFASPKKVNQGTMLFGRVRMNYYQASVPTSEVGAV